MTIAIISSSTRLGRKSHRVALALKNAVEAAGHNAAIVDLVEHPLPAFIERYAMLPDAEKTHSMNKIASLLQASQAAIFVTPEYNGGICSGLKNLMDTFGKAEFAGKAIGVASVSAGILGGIRAAQQLQVNILGIQAYPQPQVLTVGEVEKQLDEQGALINPAFEAKLQGFLNAFLGFAGKLA